MKNVFLMFSLLWSVSSAVLANDEIDVIEVLPTRDISRIVEFADPASPVASSNKVSIVDLLNSVERFAPQVIAAQADAQAIAAGQLSASAVFDPVLNGRYDGRMTGFYGGQVGDIEVRQRLRSVNATVYGGYSLSRGRLPIYEDQYLTNRGGEVRAGVSVALLRGREIDTARTGLLTARLAADEAIEEAAMQMQVIKAAAIEAYVYWLYAENTLAVYQELLEIAEQRDVAIRRAIAAGQLATITQEENRQLVLARQNQKFQAERLVFQAAADLALYLRDGAGNPVQPEFGGANPVPQNNPHGRFPLEELIIRTLEDRPDFSAVRLAVEQLKAKQRLTENDLQPNLDFKYEVRNDFGNGSPTREGTDHKVGLNLNVPLFFSRARGENQALQAELKAIRARIRLMQDRVGLALQANSVALSATEQQLAVGKAEVEVAQALREAEEARYLAGASDIFRLNAQETALANSKLRVLSAQRDHDLLLAEFFAITGKLWFQTP